MATKEYIVEEIKRVELKLGRTPGLQVFERETGIIKSEWHGKFWRSWGDAVLEAGFKPNRKNEKLSSELVLSKFAELTKLLGRIPANIDIRMYTRDHKDFPGHSTFSNHFGSKAGLLKALAIWIEDKREYSDLRSLIPTQIEDETSEGNAVAVEGLVYLMKSGEFYKIGRSDNIERRVKQVSVSMPEELSLVHTIRTDDPSGIEAYWHRRFSDKRAKGEWFKLTSNDIRVFKRRKYQ